MNIKPKEIPASAGCLKVRSPAFRRHLTVMNIKPKEILASKETLDKIETVCKRRFPNENEADECYLFIFDALKASDYKRLRDYRGKSSLKTYLYTLINALATDFSRKKYGRRRVPKRVSKLGKWAEAVWRFVCWEKFSFDEAYDLIRANSLFNGTLKEFLTKTDPIRSAPCPENPEFVSGDDEASGNILRNTADTEANPLEALIKKLDKERRIRALEVIHTAG